jgi:p-hydroxybenzoate 3-monooxygenase
MRTQVAIIGAGPAGLILGHLLHLQGIEAILLEARSRDYVEQRVRAGVLEQCTVDLLHEAGVGERLAREGLLHHGIELGFSHKRFRIDMQELTGKAVTVYGQNEVIKDLIKARLAVGAAIEFETQKVSIDRLDSEQPLVRYEKDGATYDV